MSKEYLNAADEFLDGGAEKGVVRTCRNCVSYDADAWQCNDMRSENHGYMCSPDTPGCWFHCTMADAVKVKVKVSIIREKQRLANMTATDKRIEALEMTNMELLEALKLARDFIRNGIEYGYIDTPSQGSPEAQTLGIIVDAIRKAEVNVEVKK